MTVTGGEVLTPNNAVKVLEELLPAQNQSNKLGLRPNLKPHDVKSIHATVSMPREHLLQFLSVTICIFLVLILIFSCICRIM